MRSSRVRILRIVLAGLMLSTAFGVTYALVNRPAIEVSFPGTSEQWVYVALLVVGCAGLVTLVGLWRRQRWAVALYGLLVVASFLLDVIARAPVAHQVTVVVSGVAVLALAHWNRKRFSVTPSGGA